MTLDSRVKKGLDPLILHRCNGFWNHVPQRTWIQKENWLKLFLLALLPSNINGNHGSRCNWKSNLVVKLTVLKPTRKFYRFCDFNIIQVFGAFSAITSQFLTIPQLEGHPEYFYMLLTISNFND